MTPNSAALPDIGRVYQHFKGGTYIVVGFSNFTETTALVPPGQEPPLVNYRKWPIGARGSLQWPFARPIESWNRPVPGCPDKLRFAPLEVWGDTETNLKSKKEKPMLYIHFTAPARGGGTPARYSTGPFSEEASTIPIIQTLLKAHYTDVQILPHPDPSYMEEVAKLLGRLTADAMGGAFYPSWEDGAAEFAAFLEVNTVPGLGGVREDRNPTEENPSPDDLEDLDLSLG